MKVSKIARDYGVSKGELERFIQASSLNYTEGFGSISIDDGVDTDRLIDLFKQDQAKRAEQERAEREARAEAARAEAEARRKFEQDKQRAIANMLVTSGFNFDGYSITKYSGYISGDDAVEVPREVSGLFGGRYSKAGDGLMAALVEIRKNALKELKEAAFALGCNAVIGVDFDYITLEPETATFDGKVKYLPYIVGVTANGNAVVIEKDE